MILWFFFQELFLMDGKIEYFSRFSLGRFSRFKKKKKKTGIGFPKFLRKKILKFKNHLASIL
jgi:hypothetical protein